MQVPKKVKLIRRIVKSKDVYIITLPKELNDIWSQLYHQHVKVTIEPIEL